MKKSIKTVLTVLLLLSMLVTMAACKDAGTAAAAPTTAPAATKAPTQAPTATPVPEQYPAFDFGGKTIKVGLWWEYYYSSAHTSIIDDPNLSNTETAQMKLDNVRRIEKKYNCKIEFVNLGWDGIISSINTSVAAGAPECDIYLTDLQFGIPAVANGLAQDLKGIAPEGLDLFKDQIVLKPLEALGGTYLFTEVGLPVNGIFMGYNASMIEDLGLEDPQALYKKGQWTTEKFAEYAQKGTRDTNNDGTTDIYGFGGVFTDLVNGLVMNNGGSIAGSPTEGLSSKPVTESLDLINQIYNVDKSARPWSEDWNDNLLAWSDGKVMFWTGAAWLNRQEIDAAAAEGGSLPFDFHAIPYPKGPSGDGTPTSPVSGNWYIVPAGAKDSGKVLQIFEEYMNWHKGETELRDDPSWFEGCFTSMEDVEIAYQCGSNLKLDLWNSLAPTYEFGGTIFWPVVVNKTSTVSQAVEAAKPVLQDALDAFFAK